MNNKINYWIILCILCIILVSVLSTGSKGWDWFLVIFSVIGILASSFYLIRKNEREEERQRKQKEEEERQRKQKEAKERQNQLDNIKRQIDENKKKEDAEAEFFKQQDTEYIKSLPPDMQEKLTYERIKKQQDILQIIKEYQNNISNSNKKAEFFEDINKISILIIKNMSNKKAKFFEDFFEKYNYKHVYLIPIKTSDNTHIIEDIIRNINYYNTLDENGKFNYIKQYDKTNNKNYDYSYEDRQRYH
jgi:hypothetical protein